MNQIGIDVVLNKLNDTYDEQNLELKSYGLRFLNAQGETREIICRKFTKDATKKVDGVRERGKQFYNLKRNGILMVEDMDSNHPKAIKPAMIYGFKDFQAEHWINVFH